MRVAVGPSPRLVAALVLALGGCGDDPEPPWPYQPPRTEPDPDPGPHEVTAADPDVVDPIGGSRLTVRGTGFAGSTDHPAASEVWIGGVAAQSFQVRSDTQIDVVTAAIPVGDDLDVVVVRGDLEVTLAGAIDAWSPAELPGARLFDAGSGVTTEEAVTTYEWQRLTPELHPDWRVRDGATLTWVPTIERFVAVAGWNGYPEPVGFSPVGSTYAWPPLNTTDEVWSSPDGVTWSNDLVHDNGAYERRHVHTVSWWRDRMWMIGGDTHQGFYNHDVVSSADGLTWTVELGPGATEPPWSERALQMSGVFDGKLWMAGGQDLLGVPADYVFHNDVWSTEDGVNWVQVAADAPASATRWEGCGLVTSLVEFQGRMWLLGCGQYRDDAVGTTMTNEVWSTTDGAVWQRHTDPPWVGRAWPDVVVWDGKLWTMFGYSYGDLVNGWPAGNSNEAWYTEDGETWTEAVHPDTPVPGSHAQGLAVTEDALVLAGGSHTYGIGLGEDKSVWRLVPFRGGAVGSWVDRGDGGLELTAAADESRPVLVEDAFGDGVHGLQFDGSRSVLALESAEVHDAGRTVLWVARAPYLPMPWGWEETYAPLGTLVGGPPWVGALPNASVGLSGGQVVLVDLDDALGVYGEQVYTRVAAGSGLQEGTGEVRFAGLTHASDGTVQVYVDGQPVGDPAAADYGTGRAWSQLGGSMDGPYYGPHSRFSGTVGAVIVLPEATDAATVARIHAWARGRFLVP